MAYDEMGNWVDDYSTQPDQVYGPSTGVFNPGNVSGPIQNQNTGVVGPTNQPQQSAIGNFTSQPSVDQINQYYASRGVAPQGNSAQYWASKFPELAARGRELQPGTDGTWYFNKFLSNAEEFTGGPAQTAMAMWGTTNPTAANDPSFGPRNMNQGAQPYNPYAPKSNNGNASGQASAYFNNHNVQPTGQTDGTLLGTTMTGGMNQNTGINGGAMAKQQQPPKPRYSWLGTGAQTNQSSNPMGAPSFYNQQKQQNPLPQNNMGGSF